MKYEPKYKPDEKTFQILFSQSWNLAVALCSQMPPSHYTMAELIEKWQLYFWEKLTEPYGLPPSKKSQDVGTQDFAADLEIEAEEELKPNPF